MDFRSFVEWSAMARRVHPRALARCETRVERALAAFRPDASVLDSGAPVHRCDLARAWCQLRGVPAFAGRALVCEGVRHALRIIFRVLASERSAIAIPRDVYPVYRQIAVEASVGTTTFETFPVFDIDTLLNTAARDGVDHVLLPYPLKLHGRPWTQSEVERAYSWLLRDADRRLLLDGVYSFGLPLDPALLRLLATDQVVYLDSLSKGWLHAGVFGTAIVPARDFARYAGSFRGECPARSKLLTAQQLLSHFDDQPLRLMRELARLRAELHAQLTQLDVRVTAAQNGYLLLVEGELHRLLSHNSLIAIPLSAFGGVSQNVCVASALPSLSEP